MDKFMRISLLLIVVGGAMLSGFCIRESRYFQPIKLLNLAVPPENYFFVPFSAHPRDLEVNITLTPTDFRISFLPVNPNEITTVLSNPESSLSKGIDVVGEASVTVAVEDYGCMGFLFYNPNDDTAVVSLQVRATGADYKAFVVATGFLIAGVLTTLFLTIRTRWLKKNVKATQ